MNAPIVLFKLFRRKMGDSAYQKHVTIEKSLVAMGDALSVETMRDLKKMLLFVLQISAYLTSS